MSLTVIQYADTVRMAVMADARLTPMHTVPASRWSVVIENLVSKIDQEIARIAAQAQLPSKHKHIPRITQTQASTEDIQVIQQETEETTQGPSQSSLKPPSPDKYSPPLERKGVIEEWTFY